MAAAACATLPAPVLAALAGLLAATAGLILAFALREIRRHQELARNLDRRASAGIIADHAVWLVPGLNPALVAGLRRARIYCSPDIGDCFDPGEVRAIVLHERHHEIDRAPARLLLLSALAPFVGRMPHGRHWLAAQRAAIEIAADRYAMACGVSRSTLARALLKAEAQPLAAPGFASEVDLRIKALFEAEEPARAGRGLQSWAAFVPACAGLACILMTLG